MFYKNKRVIAYTLVVIILIQQLIGNIPVNAYANESVTGSNAIENVLTPSNAIKVETSSDAELSNNSELIATDSNAINMEKINKVIELINKLPSVDEIEEILYEFEINEDWEGYEKYIEFISRLAWEAYNAYQELEDELKQYVENYEYLMDSSYIWSVRTYATTVGSKTGDLKTLTVEDSGIDFNLYNYDENINKYKDSNGVWNFRNIANHFAFSGTIHVNNDGTITSQVVGEKPSSTTESIQLVYNHLTWEKNLYNGYPVVSTESSSSTLSKNERYIGYLFGGEDIITNQEKSDSVECFEDIKNTPLVKNNDNYYVYSSKNNATDFDGVDTLYVRDYFERTDDSAAANASNFITADFLPFNTKTQELSHKVSGYTYNYGGDESTTTHLTDVKYWFGATMSSNFVNYPKGIVNDEEMVFEFSGDDDVAVYLDEILVLDILGGHSQASGTIDFNTGLVESYLDAWVSGYNYGRVGNVYNHKEIAKLAVNNGCLGKGANYYFYDYNKDGIENNDGGTTPVNDSAIRYYTTTIYECYEAAYKEQGLSDEETNELLNEMFVKDENDAKVIDSLGIEHDIYYFKDYSKHTFKWFYLERYGGSANFNVKFNLPTIPENSIQITKKILKNDLNLNVPNQYFVFKIDGTDVGGNDRNFVKTVTISVDDLKQSVDENGYVYASVFLELPIGYAYNISEINSGIYQFDSVLSESPGVTIEDNKAIIDSSGSNIPEIIFINKSTVQIGFSGTALAVNNIGQ